ncbi:hypothetical protein J580_0887 [Acinetobacter sp. 1542444]|uniref:DUF6097 family protein n=1 Tax=Acinetobacter calcoaceticus/baumannii complex TaxID=909768 RepID=UPI000446E04E|nr:MULTISPECIES: DUF6097 family protein [Acinetobacter calcoaceticus/baumannii complex]EXE63765.1 hypothetical protein J580_0887 [Acinetobacter sp. 1542444]RZH11936.1 hypothetical protein EXE02_09310 [Acinetobacter pittii]
MGNLTILGEALESAEILKNIQYHIKDNRLPISLKDDLNKQVIEVEKYFGEDDFEKLEVKKNKINIWTGVLAVPILIYCIALFLSRYVHNFGINIDVDVLNHMLFDNIFKYIWIVIIYAVIFFGLIGYFYILNNQSKKLIEKNVNKLLS